MDLKYQEKLENQKPATVEVEQSFVSKIVNATEKVLLWLNTKKKRKEGKEDVTYQQLAEYEIHFMGIMVDIFPLCWEREECTAN